MLVGNPDISFCNLRGPNTNWKTLKINPPLLHNTAKQQQYMINFYVSWCCFCLVLGARVQVLAACVWACKWDLDDSRFQVNSISGHPTVKRLLTSTSHLLVVPYHTTFLPNKHSSSSCNMSNRLKTHYKHWTHDKWWHTKNGFQRLLPNTSKVVFDATQLSFLWSIMCSYNY